VIASASPDPSTTSALDDRNATDPIVSSLGKLTCVRRRSRDCNAQPPRRVDRPAVNNCEPSGAADAPVTLRISVDTLSRPSSGWWIDHRCALREAPSSFGGRLQLGYSRFRDGHPSPSQNREWRICSRDDRSIGSRNIVYEITEATTIVRTLRSDVKDALDQRHAAGVLGHRDATVTRVAYSARSPTPAAGI
jgi:hypothetical protein